MADLSLWADPHGAVIFFGVIAFILVGTTLRLFTGQWDDWLDERWGRGSIRDTWPLNGDDASAETRAS